MANQDQNQPEKGDEFPLKDAGGFKEFGSDNYPGYFRGEWSGGGFKEIDATNLPEGLPVDPPNQNKESSNGNSN